MWWYNPAFPPCIIGTGCEPNSRIKKLFSQNLSHLGLRVCCCALVHHINTWRCCWSIFIYTYILSSAWLRFKSPSFKVFWFTITKNLVILNAKRVKSYHQKPVGYRLFTIAYIVVVFLTHLLCWFQKWNLFLTDAPRSWVIKKYLRPVYCIIIITQKLSATTKNLLHFLYQRKNYVE